MGMGNGVAGMVIIIVMTGIIPENSLRLAPVSFWRLTPGLYNQPANGMAVCSVGYNYPIISHPGFITGNRQRDTESMHFAQVSQFAMLNWEESTTTPRWNMVAPC